MEMPTCYLDCEFTDLNDPALLSVGMVDLAGAQHYVELDLSGGVGQELAEVSSQFVKRYVLTQWGRVHGAATSPRGIAERTADWLVDLFNTTHTPVNVCFDYRGDWVLTKFALRRWGAWERVGPMLRPVDVRALTSSGAARQAARATFDSLAQADKQRIGPHHALADALALRAAHQAAIGIESSTPVQRTSGPGRRTWSEREWTQS